MVHKRWLLLAVGCMQRFDGNPERRDDKQRICATNATEVWGEKQKY